MDGKVLVRAADDEDRAPSKFAMALLEMIERGVPFSLTERHLDALREWEQATLFGIAGRYMRKLSRDRDGTIHISA